MDIALVAGTNLNRLYPSRLVDRNRKDEIPVRVGSLRWKNERLARGKNQVRLTQSPAFDKLRLRRKVGGCAFLRALLNPAPDEIDFRVRQTKFVGELQLLRLGQPWRHGVRFGHVRDLPRMPFRVGVRQQREWSRFSGPMTLGAGTKHDGSDVAIERDRRRIA